MLKSKLLKHCWGVENLETAPGSQAGLPRSTHTYQIRPETASPGNYKENLLPWFVSLPLDQRNPDRSLSACKIWALFHNENDRLLTFHV